MRSLLELFGRSRLLTFDRDPETREPTVELAHEALIHEWLRLRGWIDDGRYDMRQQRELEDAAARWAASGHDESYLLRGARLAAFELWEEQATISLTKDERDFLQTSLVASDQRRRRAQWTRLVIGGVLLAATVVSVALAAFANSQRHRAEREAAASQSVALSIAAQQAAAEGDAGLALALIREAMRTDDPNEEVLQIMYDLAMVPGIRLELIGHEAEINAGAISPDGDTALTGDVEGVIIQWDIATGSEVNRFEEHDAGIIKIQFLLYPRRVMSASIDGEVLIWDSITGAVLQEISTEDYGQMTDVSLSPDGQTLITGHLNGGIYRWDLATGRLIDTVNTSSHLEGVHEVRKLAFFPDGTHLASAGGGTVTIWDLDTGGVKATLEETTQTRGAVDSLDVNPDNTHVLIGYELGDIVEWNSDLNAQISMETHDNTVLSLTYSPNGRQAISTSKDGQVVLWDMASHTPEAVFKEHEGFVSVAAFSPDGSAALSVGADGVGRVWEIRFQEWLNEFDGHQGWPLDVAISPDEQNILSGGGGLLPGQGAFLDDSLVLWNAATGEVIKRFDGHAGEIRSVAFGTDGISVYAGTAEGRVIQWAIDSGEVMNETDVGSPVDVLLVRDDQLVIGAETADGFYIWDGYSDPVLQDIGANGVTSLTITPDGSVMAIGDTTGQVSVFDWTNTRIIFQIKAHEVPVSGIAITTDGRRVASAARNQFAFVWDVKTGETLYRLGVPNQDVWDVAFSGDDRFLLTASGSRSQGPGVLSDEPAPLILWDMRSGTELAHFTGHTGIVTSIAMSQDSTWGVSGSTDGTLRSWRISPDAFVRWIDDHRLVQDLTCEQQKSYLLEADCSDDIARLEENPGVEANDLSLESRADDVYRVSLVEDISTLNPWAAEGPASTVQNDWVLSIGGISLYRLSERTFQLVPLIAAEMPPPVVEESGKWVTEIPLRDDVYWSDGEPLTAADVAFTAETALRLRMTEGNWSTYSNTNFLEAIEAIDDHTVRIVYSTRPGYGIHEYGTLIGGILPEHYWRPIVEEASAPLRALPQEASQEEVAAAVLASREALYAFQPQNEPTAGAFIVEQWIPNVVIRARRNPTYFLSGTTIVQYDDSTYEQYDPDGTLRHRLYGSGSGEVVLSYEIGPHIDRIEYVIHSTVEAAVEALTNGDADYILHSGGYPAGIINRLKNTENVSVISSPSNGYRYLAYNTRRSPMNDLAFRRAVASLIDQELLADAVVPGSAESSVYFVPEANVAWFNEDISAPLGMGLRRSERITLAVQTLEDAGYYWEGDRRPGWDDKSEQVVAGGRLIMPNGLPVPTLSLRTLWSDYDVFFPTYAAWIATWLGEIGVPVEVHTSDFPEAIDDGFSTHDFDLLVLGWSLTIYPDYLTIFFDCEQTRPDENNNSGFCDEDFQALSAKLESCTSYEMCKDVADQLQVMLLDLQPYTLLATSPTVEAYRSDRIIMPFTESLSGLQYTGAWKELVRWR